MKLTALDHQERIKDFYAAFAAVDLMAYPYFRLIYKLFDLCRQEIFEARKFGGPFRHVLDVGCGTGYHTLRIAPFCERIIGLDISAESLEVARTQAKELGINNVSFINGDITRIDFPDQSFDCVIAFGDVIGHIPHYAEMVQEISRISATGALLAFDCDNKWYLGLIHEPEERRRALAKPALGHVRTWQFMNRQLEFNTFSQRELKSLLFENRFKILKTYGFDFFSFPLREPERFQFSTSNGAMVRMVTFLNRLDIALRRFWPVNRLAYSKVIFARKT